MRLMLLAAGVAVVLSACGSAGGTSSDRVSSALAKVNQVISTAVHPPAPGPGFKVPRAQVRGLDGLDLWHAVVSPMIKPLLPLNGKPSLEDRLNPEQYAAFVLFGVDADYADGGMFEVYYYTPSLIAQQAPRLLREVGAPLHAKAFTATTRATWPNGQIPPRLAARQHQLGSFSHPQLPVSDHFWQQAEDREGTLDSIVARFIRSHPNAFFY